MTPSDSLQPPQSRLQPSMGSGTGDSPELVWREAVKVFAQRFNLPVDEVLAGNRIECIGVGFQLHYNVDADEQGLVVMMDLGQIPPATAHFVHLAMLANNARAAASVLGYQGVFPGTQRGAHCVRLDLRKCSDPPTAIGAMIASLAFSVYQGRDSFDEMLSVLSRGKPQESSTAQ